MPMARQAAAEQGVAVAEDWMLCNAFRVARFGREMQKRMNGKVKAIAR
jgi:hypothetical protein